jgi:hypothetical protein
MKRPSGWEVGVARPEIWGSRTEIPAIVRKFWAIDRRERCRGGDSGKWVLTHNPTGYSAGSYTSRRAAIAASFALDAVKDLSRYRGVIKDKPLVAKLVAAVRKHGCRIRPWSVA